MNHTVEYKGYAAYIQYSEEDSCYTGLVTGMSKHQIGFHGETIEKIHATFIEMIDFYLETCINDDVEPEIPNTILIPILKETYIKAFEKAESKGITVPKLIAEVLQTI